MDVDPHLDPDNPNYEIECIRHSAAHIMAQAMTRLWPDIKLAFGSGQRMDLTLSNEGGEVYRWSDDMMFTQAIEEVPLPAGATLPHTLSAESINLPPGTYSAKAWVTAAEAMDLTLTWTITVSS